MLSAFFTIAETHLPKAFALFLFVPYFSLNASMVPVVVPRSALQTFAAFFDKRLAHLSPEMAAKTIVNGVAKGHARVVVGWDAKAFDWLARITGSSYQRIVAAGVAKFFPWAK